jgi:hypothetical protein
MSEKFLHDGKVVTEDELYAIVEPEAAQEPEGTWRGGEFDFNDWLIESQPSATSRASRKTYKSGAARSQYVRGCHMRIITAAKVRRWRSAWHG